MKYNEYNEGPRIYRVDIGQPPRWFGGCLFYLAAIYLPTAICISYTFFSFGQKTPIGEIVDHLVGICCGATVALPLAFLIFQKVWARNPRVLRITDFTPDNGPNQETKQIN